MYSKMKRLRFKIVLVIVYLIQTTFSYCQNDYLKSQTTMGNGITTNNSTDWTNFVSTSIDVTGISKVLVTASINMRPDGSDSDKREANYRIYRTANPLDNSGLIKREIIKNGEVGVESWGIGTLVHIFDVSSLSGTISFTLEHSNQGNPKNERNIYSSARLTVIALTTSVSGYELSSDVKRLSTEVATTSNSFEPVLGLTTDVISLPFDGDIYVTASINSKSGGSGNVGEYQLESTSDGINWVDLGKPVKRTMVNNFDDGIISLVGLLSGQSAGNNYQFRISHRKESGANAIYTNNVNLVAIALNHLGEGYFPSFYNEVGTAGIGITGVSTLPEEVISTNFTTPSDIGVEKPDVYVNAQFLMSAENLDARAKPDQRMRGANQLFLYNGIDEIGKTTYLRYIPDNSNFGSGGTISLAENLDESTFYTLKMKHYIDYISNPDATEDEVLTTSEVILTGFQTFDKPISSLSNEEFLELNGVKLFSNANKIEFRSEKATNTKIRVFNMLGQQILNKSLKQIGNTSMEINNYSGVVVVTVEMLNNVFSKKLIIE